MRLLSAVHLFLILWYSNEISGHDLSSYCGSSLLDEGSVGPSSRFSAGKCRQVFDVQLDRLSAQKYCRSKLPLQGVRANVVKNGVECIWLHLHQCPKDTILIFSNCYSISKTVKGEKASMSCKKGGLAEIAVSKEILFWMTRLLPDVEDSLWIGNTEEDTFTQFAILDLIHPQYPDHLLAKSGIRNFKKVKNGTDLMLALTLKPDYALKIPRYGAILRAVKEASLPALCVVSSTRTSISGDTGIAPEVATGPAFVGRPTPQGTVNSISAFNTRNYYVPNPVGNGYISTIDFHKTCDELGSSKKRKYSAIIPKKDDTNRYTPIQLRKAKPKPVISKNCSPQKNDKLSLDFEAVVPSEIGMFVKPHVFSKAPPPSPSEKCADAARSVGEQTKSGIVNVPFFVRRELSCGQFDFNDVYNSEPCQCPARPDNECVPSANGFVCRCKKGFTQRHNSSLAEGFDCFEDGSPCLQCSGDHINCRAKKCVCDDGYSLNSTAKLKTCYPDDFASTSHGCLPGTLPDGKGGCKPTAYPGPPFNPNCSRGSQPNDKNKCIFWICPDGSAPDDFAECPNKKTPTQKPLTGNNKPAPPVDDSWYFWLCRKPNVYPDANLKCKDGKQPDRWYWVCKDGTINIVNGKCPDGALPMIADLICPNGLYVDKLKRCRCPHRCLVKSRCEYGRCACIDPKMVSAEINHPKYGLDIKNNGYGPNSAVYCVDNPGYCESMWNSECPNQLEPKKMVCWNNNVDRRTIGELIDPITGRAYLPNQRCYQPSKCVCKLANHRTTCVGADDDRTRCACIGGMNDITKTTEILTRSASPPGTRCLNRDCPHAHTVQLLFYVDVSKPVTPDMIKNIKDWLKQFPPQLNGVFSYISLETFSNTLTPLCKLNVGYKEKAWYDCVDKIKSSTSGDAVVADVYLKASKEMKPKTVVKSRGVVMILHDTERGKPTQFQKYYAPKNCNGRDCVTQAYKLLQQKDAHVITVSIGKKHYDQQTYSEYVLAQPATQMDNTLVDYVLGLTCEEYN